MGNRWGGPKGYALIGNFFFSFPEGLFRPAQHAINDDGGGPPLPG
jgi:hypothetical protein